MLKINILFVISTLTKKILFGISALKEIILFDINWLKNNIPFLIAILLMILYFYAAYQKIINHSEFRTQMQQSPILQKYASWVSWGLPIGEILLCITLSWQRTRLIGFYGSLFLLSMFTSYILVILNYSFYIPCSCGGIISDLSWEGHLVFNGVFLGLTIWGIYLTGRKVVQLKQLTSIINNKNMKKTLHNIGTCLLIAMGSSSFQTIKKTAISFSGWYAAAFNLRGSRYVLSGQAPYLYSPIYFPTYTGFIPPMGSGSGQCSFNSAYVCAAYFTLNGFGTLVNSDDNTAFAYYISGTYNS